MRLIFILSLAWVGLSFAQEASYEPALKLYQEQKYQEAEKAFRRFATENTNNKFAYYNWGLSAYRSGLEGVALGAWRRALTLDPDFSPARKALQFAKNEMPAEVFSTSASHWEDLRAAVLERATLDRFLGLTLLLFIFSAALLIRYAGARQRGLKDETTLPPFPTVSVLMAVGFVVSLSLSVAKVIADNETRATVIQSGVSVRSGPNENDNALFELIEGVQVTVRREHDSWFMVTYPGGLSGWVPADTLIVTSGRR